MSSAPMIGARLSADVDSGQLVVDGDGRAGNVNGDVSVRTLAGVQRWRYTSSDRRLVDERPETKPKRHYETGSYSNVRALHRSPRHAGWLVFIDLTAFSAQL